MKGVDKVHAKGIDGNGIKIGMSVLLSCVSDYMHTDDKMKQH
jgi:hypothetical protein